MFGLELTDAGETQISLIGQLGENCLPYSSINEVDSKLYCTDTLLCKQDKCILVEKNMNSPLK